MFVQQHKNNMDDNLDNLRLRIDAFRVKRRLGLHNDVKESLYNIADELINLYEEELERQEHCRPEYQKSELRLLTTILDGLRQLGHIAKTYDEVTKFVQVKVSCVQTII